MLQAFRRDRRRNTAEFFFEKVEGRDQSPPFVGHFGAAAMRTAGAGDERRARQKIIDRVDSIPGGLIAEPCFFRRLGDALVLHHGFEQGDALASDKKPSPGAPGQQAIYLSRRATRHSVLSKSAGRLELSSATPNIIQFVSFRILAWPCRASRSKPTVESWPNRKSSRFCRIRRGRNYAYAAWPNGQTAWEAISDREGCGDGQWSQSQTWL